MGLQWMLVTSVTQSKGNAVNIDTASAQDKVAALDTSGHYGNECVKSRLATMKL
jgi:hypothetical protein